MVKRFNSENAPGAIGPYSHSSIANNMIFTSGQLPLDPATGKFPEGGVAEQTDQAMKNLGAILKDAGSDWSKVIKTTVFIKDMNDFPVVNEVYSKYLGEAKPSRSCVEVARLPMDALVEIEGIAVID